LIAKFDLSVEETGQPNTILAFL